MQTETSGTDDTMLALGGAIIQRRFPQNFVAALHHRKERTAVAGKYTRTSGHVRGIHIEPHLGKAPVAPGFDDADPAPRSTKRWYFMRALLLSPDGYFKRRHRLTSAEWSHLLHAPVTDFGHQPRGYEAEECRPTSFGGG